jgi:mevalonate kinase
VKFKQGQITPLHTQMPLRMLLTNTQVGRNTKALLAGVGERALRHPATMGAIFKAIDEIAEEVVTILLTPPEKAGDEKYRDEELVSTDECGPHPVLKTEQEVRLEELVEMNQGLLQGIGVSHLSIESICQMTAAYRLQSKLTGAGGGGCVLTLLPHSILTRAF